MRAPPPPPPPPPPRRAAVPPPPPPPPLFGRSRQEDLELRIGQNYGSYVPPFDDRATGGLRFAGGGPLPLDENFPELRVCADLGGSSRHLGCSQCVLRYMLPAIQDARRRQVNGVSDRGERRTIVEVYPLPEGHERYSPVGGARVQIGNSEPFGDRSSDRALTTPSGTVYGYKHVPTSDPSGKKVS
jgi:hypothetical protein